MGKKKKLRKQIVRVLGETMVGFLNDLTADPSILLPKQVDALRQILMPTVSAEDARDCAKYPCHIRKISLIGRMKELDSQRPRSYVYAFVTNRGTVCAAFLNESSQPFAVGHCIPNLGTDALRKFFAENGAIRVWYPKTADARCGILGDRPTVTCAPPVEELAKNWTVIPDDDESLASALSAAAALCQSVFPEAATPAASPPAAAPAAAEPSIKPVQRQFRTAAAPRDLGAMRAGRKLYTGDIRSHDSFWCSRTCLGLLGDTPEWLHVTVVDIVQAARDSDFCTVQLQTDDKRLYRAALTVLQKERHWLNLFLDPPLAEKTVACVE